MFFFFFFFFQYLCGSNRKDNIFIDPGYQTFEQELNKILRSWQPSILPDGNALLNTVAVTFCWDLLVFIESVAKIKK